jgi:hypothetical protein
MRMKNFKGNKQSLPSKRCAACGREMTWRKKWAKNWTEVKFCSDACRRKSPPTVATLTLVPFAESLDPDFG